MNFAHALTLLRFVLAPIIGFLYLMSSKGQFVAFILFIIAILSDCADGYVARSMGVKSELGRDLDPLADKFLTTFLLVMIVAKKGYNPWIALSAALIIVREVVVTGMRSIVGGGNIPVTKASKFKTFFHFLTIGVMLFFSGHKMLTPVLDKVSSVMMCVSAFLACFSTVGHIKRFISFLKKGA